MNKVLITGGTGFLGKHLNTHLRKDGNDISILSRKISGDSTYAWNVENNFIDPNALKKTNTIIHLAGASIADKRWTRSYKKEIVESRIKSTNLLYDALKKYPHAVDTFISVSAIGFYGNTGDVWAEEEFHAKEDFLAQTCHEWEKAAAQIGSLGIRLVTFRIGLVLSKDDGILPVLIRPVKYFAGAPLGSGNQYMSWIHIDDLCRMFSYAIQNKNFHGVYNAVAPSPVTQKEFLQKIAAVLHRPLWPIKVPPVLLNLILGEKASIVLNGQRVSSEKIRMSGFNYLHTDLSKVLTELFSEPE
jgi:uncharacterized protein (TIGR01777 family)